MKRITFANEEAEGPKDILDAYWRGHGHYLKIRNVEREKERKEE